MFYEAFLAGLWASIGSTLGKLTGTASIVFSRLLQKTPLRTTSFYARVSQMGDSYLIWGGLFAAMVMANTWGCRHYLRSLDEASNSVAPTIISAASSYVLSGVIGITLFEEASSVRWWAGAMMIVCGLSLVARPRTKQKAQ